MLSKEQIQTCIINNKFASRTFYKLKKDHNMLYMTPKDAFIIYHEIIEPRCYCGNELKFKSFNVGFSKFCSNQCSNNDPGVIIKQQNNRDYEAAKIKQREAIDSRSDEEKEEIVNRIKQTKLLRYGNENYNNRYKNKETCLHKYGVDNVQKVKEINDKSVKTQNEKYGGVFNPTQFKLTCNEKYGVDYPLQNKDVANKFSKMISEKYSEGKSNMPGSVYVIESDNFIKIGVASNLDNRLKALVRIYGNLKVLKVFKTDYSYELERILHNTFSKFNIVLDSGNGRTEWFTKDILSEFIV